MKRIFISYASRGYVDSQEQQHAAARRYGADVGVMYRRDDIERMEAYPRLCHILDKRRYAGWCLWKPMILLDAMSRAEEGDIIFMLDSDYIPVTDLSPLFDICLERQGIMLFGGNAPASRRSIKRDCYVLMGLDEQRYWEGLPVWGGCNMWMKNARNIAFVEEWFRYASDERLLSPFSSHTGQPELPGFVSNACDQAVLTLLAFKHGIEAYRCPHPVTNYAKLPKFRVPGEELGGTQIGVTDYQDGLFPNSPYGTLIQDVVRDRRRLGTIAEGLQIAWEHMSDDSADSFAYGGHVLGSILEHDPENADAHCLIGMRFMLPGEPSFPLYQPDRALHHLRRALRLRPGFPHAAYALGALLAKEGALAEGASLHKTLLEAAPAFYLARQRLDDFAVLPARMGSAKLEALSRADPNIARLLAAARLRAGDAAGAARAAGTAMDLEPGDPSGEFLAALADGAQNRTKTAAAYLAGILDRSPGWLMARQVVDLAAMRLPLFEPCRLWLGGY